MKPTIEEKLQATEITEADIQPQPLTVQEPSIMQMMDFCIRNGGASGENRNAIEMLKELRAMRAEDRAYAAKRLFDAAMEKAQKRISLIAPDKLNDKGKPYASFKALNETLRPIYLDEGFTLSFNAAPSPDPATIYVLCNVAHSGHTQPYMTPMAVDPSGPKGGGVMNKMQAHKAALSYGRSALLAIIFNIAIDDKLAEPEGLDDLNERLENMRDGDRKSLEKVYADNWSAAVKINDLTSLWEFIKLRINLCQDVDELKGVARAAFDGVAAFKNEGLSKAVTARFNARKGELLK